MHKFIVYIPSNNYLVSFFYDFFCHDVCLDDSLDVTSRSSFFYFHFNPLTSTHIQSLYPSLFFFPAHSSRKVMFIWEVDQVARQNQKHLG